MQLTSVYLSEKNRNEIIVPFLTTLKQEATRADYMVSLLSFLDLVKKDVSEINSSDAGQWVSYLMKQVEDEKIEYRTALKKFRHLTSIFHYMFHNAEKMELDKFSNPFDGLTMKEVGDQIKYDELPSISEMDAVFSVLRKKDDNMLLIAVLFAFKCMMTISEICNAKCEDLFQAVDGSYYLELKALNEWTENRYCYVPEDIVTLIMKYCISAKNSSFTYIISNKNGAKTNPQTLRRRLERSCVANAIPFYTFNKFRNAGIAFAYSNSGDVELVASSIGLKTNTHIARLKSLKLHRLNAAEYINVVIKE